MISDCFVSVPRDSDIREWTEDRGRLNAGRAHVLILRRAHLCAGASARPQTCPKPRNAITSDIEDSAWFPETCRAAAVDPYLLSLAHRSLSVPDGTAARCSVLSDVDASSCRAGLQSPRGTRRGSRSASRRRVGQELSWPFCCSHMASFSTGERCVRTEMSREKTGES